MFISPVMNTAATVSGVLFHPGHVGPDTFRTGFIVGPLIERMRVVEIKVLAGPFIIQMHPYGDPILAVGGVPFRLRRHVGE